VCVLDSIDIYETDRPLLVVSCMCISVHQTAKRCDKSMSEFHGRQKVPGCPTTSSEIVKLASD